MVKPAGAAGDIPPTTRLAASPTTSGGAPRERGRSCQHLAGPTIRGFPADITDETPLRSLRLDSLALEELRVLIEERLDIDLDEVSLTPRNTVGQLVTAVDGNVPA
ncbi:hypothetical protein Srufu_005610 [Streptomyces libani subsp. rufus]|nr:hypothetical protein Srufu_005610 [Streptomyces libani subsp. rufus]